MDWKIPEKKKLIEAFLALESSDEAQLFLRDLMTSGEIDEFARRLKAAEMLSRKVPYVTIEKEIGFSSTTVARVARWLNNGNGGYKSIIAKIYHHNPRQAGRGLS